MKALSRCLNQLKEATLADGMSEPNLQLFVIKQSFVTGNPSKMGFGWSETKVRSRTPRKNAQTNEPARQTTSYLSRMSQVKHAVTADGFACIEFRVRKLKSEGGGRPDELTIQVLQNNQSFVTEVRVQGIQKILEVVNATIHKSADIYTSNKVKILFAF